MHLQETHGGTDIRSKSSGLWWPVYIGRAEQSCAYDVRYPYYADSTSRGEVKFVLWSTDCSGLNSAAAKQLLPMQHCRLSGSLHFKAAIFATHKTVPLSLRFNLDCATTECLRLCAGREHVGPSYWLAVHTAQVLQRTKKLG